MIQSVLWFAHLVKGSRGGSNGEERADLVFNSTSRAAVQQIWSHSPGWEFFKYGSNTEQIWIKYRTDTDQIQNKYETNIKRTTIQWAAADLNTFTWLRAFQRQNTDSASWSLWLGPFQVQTLSVVQLSLFSVRGPLKWLKHCLNRRIIIAIAISDSIVMDTPGDIIRARHWHAISWMGGSLGGAWGAKHNICHFCSTDKTFRSWWYGQCGTNLLVMWSKIAFHVEPAHMFMCNKIGNIRSVRDKYHVWGSMSVECHRSKR